MTWLLGNMTAEVASRPLWKICHHPSGGLEAEWKRRSRGGLELEEPRLEIIKIPPLKQSEVARIHQRPPLKAFLQTERFHRGPGRTLFPTQTSVVKPLRLSGKPLKCSPPQQRPPEHRVWVHTGSWLGGFGTKTHSK